MRYRDFIFLPLTKLQYLVHLCQKEGLSVKTGQSSRYFQEDKYSEFRDGVVVLMHWKNSTLELPISKKRPFRSAFAFDRSDKTGDVSVVQQCVDMRFETTSTFPSLQAHLPLDKLAKWNLKPVSDQLARETICPKSGGITYM